MIYTKDCKVVCLSEWFTEKSFSWCETSQKNAVWWYEPFYSRALLSLRRIILMGRPKLKFRNLRILQKNNSGTYTLSIPIEIIDEIGWRSKQKLKVERKGNKVIITDA